MTDGGGLSATFNNPWSVKWFCNASTTRCGALVGEINNNAVRFVVVVIPTLTVSLSSALTQSLSDSFCCVTQSVTFSRSRSSTQNASSPTNTWTASYSSSATADGLSCTQSRTSTPTLSPPVSPTLSLSLSPRYTGGTLSFTPRLSETESVALTATPRPSLTPSTSESRSKNSRSRSMSTTVRHLSLTSSLLVTATASRGVTASESSTATPLHSASVSVSASRPNASVSLTWVLSRSRSIVSTDSPTPSQSTSSSATPTHSETRLPSTTTSTSLTMTVQPTPTNSPSTVGSHSHTLPTPSATMYCALVPAPGRTVVDVLMPVIAASNQIALAAPTESATSDSTYITAGAVPRQALLQMPTIVFKLSVQMGGSLRGRNSSVDAWSIATVTLDVFLSGSTTTIQSGVVPSSIAAITVSGLELVVTCVVHQPIGTGRWLPAGLSALRDVTLRFQVTLRCPTDIATTHNVVIEVSSAGQSMALANEIRTANAVSQYSTSVAGPTAGSSVGRVSAMRSLVSCSGDAGVSGMLPISVGASACVGGDANVADARGAVLGNLVVWVACCAGMGIVAVTYATAARVPYKRAVETLGMPSQLLPVVIATIPTTVAAAFVLLRSVCIEDLALGSMGVAMSVAPIAALAAVASLVPSKLQRKRVRRIEPPVSGALFASLRRVWSRLMHRTGHWGPPTAVSTPAAHTSNDVSALRWDRVATVIVLEYSSVWYVGVDTAALTAAAALGAVGMLESAPACRVAAAAVVALYGSQMLLCAMARPFTTLFSHVFTLASLMLSTVSVGCQTWYLFASQADNANLNGLSFLLTMSGTCDFLVVVTGFARTLMDVWDVLHVCHRHMRVLARRCVEHGDDTPPAVLVVTAAAFNDGCLPAPPPRAATPELAERTTDVEPLHDEDAFDDMLAEFDGFFWQSDGTAAVGLELESSVLGNSDIGRIATALEQAMTVGSIGDHVTVKEIHDGAWGISLDRDEEVEVSNVRLWQHDQTEESATDFGSTNFGLHGRPRTLAADDLCLFPPEHSHHTAWETDGTEESMEPPSSG